jgi:hypothetical protein
MLSPKVVNIESFDMAGDWIRSLEEYIREPKVGSLIDGILDESRLLILRGLYLSERNISTLNADKGLLPFGATGYNFSNRNWPMLPHQDFSNASLYYFPHAVAIHRDFPRSDNVRVALTTQGTYFLDNSCCSNLARGLLSDLNEIDGFSIPIPDDLTNSALSGITIRLRKCLPNLDPIKLNSVLLKWIMGNRDSFFVYNYLPGDIVLWRDSELMHGRVGGVVGDFDDRGSEYRVYGEGEVFDFVVDRSNRVTADSCNGRMQMFVFDKPYKL